MKFRLLAGLLFSIELMACISCSNNNSTSTTTTVGNLYVTTAGNSALQAYGITLTTGAITGDGQGVATGTAPSAMAIAPGGAALVVANAASDNLSVYAINGDGSVTAVSGNPATGHNPVALAFNPAGTFLFVANQGLSSVVTSPLDSSISVFSVSGTTLTSVGTFSTVTPGVTTSTEPDAVAVSASGNYLYVANSFTNTVSMFDIGSTGALTQSTFGPYAVGLNPSSLGIAVTTPGGQFLYIANFSDNNVSAFAICDTKSTATCSNANSPDGSLAPVTGSPFSAGLGPISISTDATVSFLFVADKTSNQVSQYRISGGTGALTANTPAAVSTGTTPVGVAVILGTDMISSTGGTTEYLYVPNNGGTSVSIFSFDSTVGQLGVVGTPTATVSGGPSAVAVR